MDLKTALARLEELKGLMDRYFVDQEKFPREGWDRIYELYGEVKEVINRIEGQQKIEVDAYGGHKTIHPNYISAGWLSGRTFHTDTGRTQLVKVIGKVRQMVANPGAPETPASVSQLTRSLQRFRECCQYIATPPANERAVQDVVWIMLRAQFDRVDREDTLPRFGARAYRPDFGVPDLSTFVEVKFIGEKTGVADIQEEILADVPGYLNAASRYTGIVVLVYDAAHKLRDPRKFIEDLRSVQGIVEVLVVPGIG